MKVSALTILDMASDAINDRAAERDLEQERSMRRTVDIYNAWSGKNMSEHDGWMFMLCLKMGRSQGGQPTLDDYTDMAAYPALAAECIDFKNVKIPEDDDEYEEDLYKLDDIEIEFEPEFEVDPPCTVDPGFVTQAADQSNPLDDLPTAKEAPQRKWDTQKYLGNRTSSTSSNKDGSSSQPTATKNAPASNGGTSSKKGQTKTTSSTSTPSSTPAGGASSQASSAGSRSSTTTNPSTKTGSQKSQAAGSKPPAAADTTTSSGKRGTKGASK